MDIIVGTAGHIDHGKTALVKALTGVDADRLPEEKRRGITIDIGFAELDLGDVRVGFVDVPGHERFVKNMLAGASGMDLVMLVIAADEGVMPQTREHFDICRLLDTKAGLIVLTKKDLADAEMLDLVKLETADLVAGSFLENSPVIAVSAKRQEGIEELKSQLIEIVSRIPTRTNDHIARLPIDRSFTVKGFGAVVTGTLASGEIREADEMDLLPDGETVRVRGLQSHGKSVSVVNAGQRAAVNLGGIDHSEISRGMVLSEKGVLKPTQIFDAEVEVVESAKRPMRSRQRVRVHIGTVETLARVHVLNTLNEINPGARDFVQLRLEGPVVGIVGERFIIRSYSPQVTIAGGKILDSLAQKHRHKEIPAIRQRLNQLLEAAKSNEITKLFVEAAGDQGLTFTDLQARTGWRVDILKDAVETNLKERSILAAESLLVSSSRFDAFRAATLDEIESYHFKEPLAKGIPRETLRERLFGHISLELFKAVIEYLRQEKKITLAADLVAIASHEHVLNQAEQKLKDNLIRVLTDSGLEVPKLDDLLSTASANTNQSRENVRKILKLLVDSREIVKVSEEFYFAGSIIDLLITKVKAFASNSDDRLIDVPKFKEIAGVSRKYAIPLLEYFDREKVTVRAGDKRMIL